MKLKQITPKEYAAMYGCHVSYIQRMLKKGKIDKLPHIKKVRKFSRFFTLDIPANLSAKDFQK